MEKFVQGQRWYSETEPELGSGIVLEANRHVVAIHFQAAGETRRYAMEHAPLQRVTFRPGDRIKGDGNQAFILERVEERAGLRTYIGGGQALPESQLADALGAGNPIDRLLRGQADDSALFELRADSLRYFHESRRSPVRGLTGPRVALIPHQLSVAAEVAGRHAPRVLLADEVGLGKTIEAGLILHRLMMMERVARVLIIVPDSLQNQWFVELLRRFNLLFALFDEERCAAIEANNPGLNPFSDSQTILCGLGLFSAVSRREQAVAEQWDLLIVDEAHHLRWSVEQSSPEYDLVQALAARTRAVLLLTATPEQLGLQGHFARLRLLDPERYGSYEAFLAETVNYRGIATLADQLLKHRSARGADLQQLVAGMKAEPELRARLATLAHEAASAEQMLRLLLDRHGTGRVMFRNTRHSVGGFPARRAHLIPLQIFAENSGESALRMKVQWLAGFIRADRTRKILLICHAQEMVLQIEEELRRQITMSAGLFHEGLSLLQRDRNAAWFAEEDGAQLLICSEIGGEGRNFQFAHHLALFDLPDDPELLEQRIGRLDRIGQTQEIQIHIPYIEGSAEEIWARWYHLGLAAFERSLSGGARVKEHFAGRLPRSCDIPPNNAIESLAALIAETKQFHTDLNRRLEEGRDHLLELNSHQPELADHLIRQITRGDQDPSLALFITRVFDHLGIRIERLTSETMVLGGGDLFKDAFPALREGGMTFTLNRQVALSRDDIGFLTWEHPVVTAAIESVLGTESGTSSVLITPEAVTMLLECVYVIECVAQSSLHAETYLGAQACRVVMDSEGQNVTTAAPKAWKPHLQSSRITTAFVDKLESLEPLIRELESLAGNVAEQVTAELTRKALRTVQEQMGSEIHRLCELQRVNPGIRDEEIALARQELGALETSIRSARPRLDAVRIIFPARAP